MFSPHRSGRLKVRLKNEEARNVYMQAESEAEKNIFPQLKRFINGQPLIDRIKMAILIIQGRF